MATMKAFGFGPGENRQLGRLESGHWGSPVTVNGAPRDPGVQIAVDEIVQVLKSLMDRDDGIASYLNNQVQNIINQILQVVNIDNRTVGLTRTVQIPLTYTVTVSACTVTLTVATYTTLTFVDGLLVGAT